MEEKKEINLRPLWLTIIGAALIGGSICLAIYWCTPWALEGSTEQEILARLALPAVAIAGLGAIFRVVAHIGKSFERTNVKNASDFVDFLGKCLAVSAFFFAGYSGYTALLVESS